MGKRKKNNDTSTNPRIRQWQYASPQSASNSLDELLLPKEPLEVPQLQYGNHNANTKGHDTEPCNPAICSLAHFPHLYFPEGPEQVKEPPINSGRAGIGICPCHKIWNKKQMKLIIIYLALRYNKFSWIAWTAASNFVSSSSTPYNKSQRGYWS